VPTPTDVAGLTAWYKADSITPVGAGVAVPSWADSSGNGKTLTTGAGTPVYAPNTINGLPSLNTGGGEWYTNTLASNLSPFTYFAVCKPSLTAPSCLVGSSVDGGMEWRLDNTAPALIKQFQAVIATGTTGPGVGVWAVQTASYTDGPSGNYAFHLNGTANGSGTHSITLVAGGTQKVFRGSTGGPDSFSGNFAELIMYSRVLTAPERATVHSYLQDKYAIPVSDYTAGIPAFSGSGALSGTGGIGASGTPRPQVTVAFSGAGALVAGLGVPRPAAAATLTGTGGLAAGGVPAAAQAVALSGMGGLSAAGAPRPAQTVALSGAGTLTAGAAPAVAQTAALVGTGTLTPRHGRPHGRAGGGPVRRRHADRSGVGDAGRDRHRRPRRHRNPDRGRCPGRRRSGRADRAGALTAAGAGSEAGQAAVTLGGDGTLTAAGTAATGGAGSPRPGPEH
jgi:hypothetical protein